MNHPNTGFTDGEAEDIMDELMALNDRTPDGQDEQGLDEPGAAAPAPEPRDPAEIATAHLLRELASRQVEPFGKSELVILEVTNETWLPLVARLIRPVLYGWEGPPSHSRFSRHNDKDAPAEVYEPDEVNGLRLLHAVSADIAEELLAGRAVWAVAHEAGKQLPPELLEAADRRLALPSFDVALFRAFLTEATGEPPLEDLPQIEWAELSPSVLRIASRQTQGADNYARRIARIVSGNQAASHAKKIRSRPPARKLALADLHGMDHVIEWGRSLALDVKAYKEGTLEWSEVDPGALLYGPPGTGKTEVAQAIAGHCGVPFYPTSYAEWQSQSTGHLGDVTRAIRNVFEQARKTAPSIIFIDELDTVNSRGGGSKNKYQEWWTAIINTLLEQLDGVVGREGVVVLAATNNPEKIDPAIRRSGRLDRQIPVGFPDVRALKEIYRLYLDGALPENDLERIAAISAGRTGADVERIARGARRRARRDGREVGFTDVFRELAGPLPPPGDRSLWPTAVHEAAHAVAAEMLQPGRLQSVSIFAPGMAAGQTVRGPDRTNDMTAAGIDGELVILLAGRAVEEVILGSCTGGAGGNEASDLATATWLSFTAETAYGLGTTGLLWSDVPEIDDLHERLAERPEAAAAAKARMERAYGWAKRLVAEARPRIEALAAVLLERFVLTGEEVTAVLEACDPCGMEANGVDKLSG